MGTHTDTRGLVENSKERLEDGDANGVDAICVPPRTSTALARRALLSTIPTSYSDPSYICAASASSWLSPSILAQQRAPTSHVLRDTARILCVHLRDKVCRPVLR